MFLPHDSSAHVIAPSVSVIVPCYNSERTIRACLGALLNQQTPIPYDVTVVDSSTDQTPDIVAREFPSVRLIHLTKRAYGGAARNVGIRATRAPYCLMIDSDCVASPDVIDRVIARHREARHPAVGGSLRNGTPRSLSGWVGYLIEFKDFMPSAPMRLTWTVPPANLAYRRETFERHGCFDDDVWLGEDILFHWKLYSAGEPILFDPAIQVTHLNRTGWRTVLGYQVDLGRHSALARRRGGLPGSYLVRYPMLIPLLPFARLARAAASLIRHDLQAFLVFLLVWPMYLLAAAFWSFGFFQGAVNKR
ncbi:MAG TPA: glycosyltransferase [Blastocatellia bacterium]|nr:glycosyltransferase [Blastocatellia bacterium]